MSDHNQDHEKRTRMFVQLVDVAVGYHNEAVACARADCYRAACVMIAAALEAELLAMTIALEGDLKAAQRWPSGKGRPENWGLGDLVDLALRAGWLAAPVDVAEEDIVSQDEIREMLTFVKEIRNLAAHPGRYVRESLDLELDHATYRTAYDVVRTTFNYTYSHLKTLLD